METKSTQRVTNSLAVTSLMYGIVATFFLGLWIVSIALYKESPQVPLIFTIASGLLGAVAIGTGMYALRQIAALKEKGELLAATGILLGLPGFVPALLWLLIYLLLFLLASFIPPI